MVLSSSTLSELRVPYTFSKVKLFFIPRKLTGRMQLLLDLFVADCGICLLIRFMCDWKFVRLSSLMRCQRFTTLSLFFYKV